MRFFLLSVLCIGLMVTEHRQPGMQKVRSILSESMVPFQRFIMWPGQLFVEAETHLASRKALLSENAQLRTHSLLLNARLQKLAALEQENAQLRNLLKAMPKNDSEKVLAAQLLGINSDPFMREVLLDKGTQAGVYPNQAVIDASGIMGQVIQVTPTTSRVLLISDIRSAIPVQNTRTGAYSIAAGLGNSDTLRLLNVPVTADVRVGDGLVSSGLGGYYPAGYPLGVVSTVVHAPGARYANIDVAASAQLDRSQHVLLIWPTQKNNLASVVR